MLVEQIRVCPSLSTSLSLAVPCEQNLAELRNELKYQERMSRCERSIDRPVISVHQRWGVEQALANSLPFSLRVVVVGGYEGQYMG